MFFTNGTKLQLIYLTFFIFNTHMVCTGVHYNLLFPRFRKIHADLIYRFNFKNRPNTEALIKATVVDFKLFKAGEGACIYVVSFC